MDNRYFFFSNCTKRSCQYTFSIDMSTWAIGNHPPPPYKKKKEKKNAKKKKKKKLSFPMQLPLLYDTNILLL